MRDRATQATEERMYLILQKAAVEGELRREYVILSQTGNVHTVTISQTYAAQLFFVVFLSRCS